MAPSSPEIFTESLEKLVRKFDADKLHICRRRGRAYSYLKAAIGSTFVARRAGT